MRLSWRYPGLEVILETLRTRTDKMHNQNYFDTFGYRDLEHDQPSQVIEGCSELDFVGDVEGEDRKQ